MYRRNRSGPNTEPWGTPCLINGACLSRRPLTLLKKFVNDLLTSLDCMYFKGISPIIDISVKNVS